MLANQALFLFVTVPVSVCLSVCAKATYQKLLSLYYGAPTSGSISMTFDLDLDLVSYFRTSPLLIAMTPGWQRAGMCYPYTQFN